MYSLNLTLLFLDKPMCRPDQKKVYGVARNEAAHILCEVDAFPPPEAFKWSFNNTAETLDMPQSGFEKHSPRASKLTYIPIKVTKWPPYCQTSIESARKLVCMTGFV